MHTHTHTLSCSLNSQYPLNVMKPNYSVFLKDMLILSTQVLTKKERNLRCLQVSAETCGGFRAVSLFSSLQSMSSQQNLEKAC